MESEVEEEGERLRVVQLIPSNPLRQPPLDRPGDSLEASEKFL
jgi:hypothetical protein